VGRAARRRTKRAAAGLLVLGVAGGLLSGCGGVDRAVEVSPPGHTPQCDAATRLWPHTVSGKQRRMVRDSGGPEPNARAWGDPAIIATCGWPALGPTDKECLDVDGVYWVAEPLSDGVKFTTFGRDPAIEVLVPKAYQPEPLLLPAFGPAAKALPTNGRQCR
jgi:hypothetical protein